MEQAMAIHDKTRARQQLYQYRSFYNGGSRLENPFRGNSPAKFSKDVSNDDGYGEEWSRSVTGLPPLYGKNRK